MSRDLASLLENFPPRDSKERAALLAAARSTPLVYGPWKQFKKLYKLAEAPALAKANDVAAGEVDVELLATLTARLDAAPLATNQAQLQPIAVPSKLPHAKHVSGGGFSYSVAPRHHQWDGSGWRLVVRATAQNPTLTDRLTALSRRLGLATPSEGEAVAFDFNAHSWIGYLEGVSLKDNQLKIKSSHKTFSVDVSDPSFLHLANHPPSLQTMEYMKRRTRRLLRHLSVARPDLYLPVVLSVLRATKGAALDPAVQWAAMDALFANSPRWRQNANSRGPYRRLKTSTFVRRRREERAPAIWDTDLDAVRQAFTDEAVPPQASEMALKVLWAHGHELPTVSRTQLKRFLQSESPLLQSVATRGLAQEWRNGATLDGSTAVRLMLSASAATRRELQAWFATFLTTVDGEWQAEFSKQLMTQVGSARYRNLRSADASGPSRRRRTAGNLLIAHFEGQVGEADFWMNLEFFATLSPAAFQWALNRVRLSSQRGNLAALDDIALLPDNLRHIVMQAFASSAAQSQPSKAEAMPLVSRYDQAQNETGWQFLASTAITPAVLREVWQRIFFAWNEEMQNAAFRHPAALQLFRRAQIDGATLSDWLLAQPVVGMPLWPSLNTYFSTEFFAAVLERVPAPTKVLLVLDVEPEKWNAVREILLRTLDDADLLSAFWQSIFERLDVGEDAALRERVLDDTAFGAALERVPQEEFANWLVYNAPQHEALLQQWLRANVHTLQRQDAALLATATHALPSIRNIGLQQIEAVGLDLPLALRLMESGIPQSSDTGRKYFEGAAEDPSDLALALCDSPEATVRQYGRDFITARQSTLMGTSLLQKLVEHSDPIMQSWVAEQLAGTAALPNNTPEFDAAVLKARGRARRAKEAVKKRINETPINTETPTTPIDVATLLETARSRTVRDREWALQQLARRALAGENIPDVAVREADTTIKPS